MMKIAIMVLLCTGVAGAQDFDGALKANNEFMVKVMNNANKQMKKQMAALNRRVNAVEAAQNKVTQKATLQAPEEVPAEGYKPGMTEALIGLLVVAGAAGAAKNAKEKSQ